jgi:ribosomal protein L9
MVLLEDRDNLGKKGDIVRVARTEVLRFRAFYNDLAGYARNYLHPETVAVYATEPNIIRHSLPYLDKKSGTLQP